MLLSVLSPQYERGAEPLILRDVNPWALQRMAEILLEADQRGLWQAKPETKAELQKIYLSVEGELEERSDEHS